MWATAADVTSFTGLALPATPDPNAVMSLASSDITIYANRTEAASAAMSTRDLHWLRMATAFQAAWLTEQPDYLARVNFRTSTVDGESVSFRSDSQQNLSPMASRALKNLSWKSSRTLRTPDVAVPAGGSGYEYSFLDEESDPYSDWEDL